MNLSLRIAPLCALAVWLGLSACSRHDAEAKQAPSQKSPSQPPQKEEAPQEITPAGLSALLSKHKGQPILINVFASWCSPCKKELPDLARLQKEHPKLVVVGIDVDEKTADAVAFLPSVPKAMKVYLGPKGVTPLLPSLHLPADWNESFPAGWEHTIPLTFVYGADGTFETGAVGQLTEEAFLAIGKLAPAK